MIEDDDKKELMYAFAKIVAASTQEHESSEDEKLLDVGTKVAFERDLYIDEDDDEFQLVKSCLNSGDWFVSKKEQSLLDEFSVELGLNKNTDSYSSIGYGYLHEDLYRSKPIFTGDNLLECGRLISQIPHISLEKRREILIESAIRQHIVDFEERVSDYDTDPLSDEEKKVMLFELISLAYADLDYAKLEKFAIEAIAKELGLDSETIGEMEEVVRSFKKIYEDGLELITE
ncbi:hypothetical protein [Desulfobaculum senezii]